MHRSFARRGVRECLATLALGLAAVPAVALAAPDGGATAVKTPIEFEFYNGCTGEFVQITGTMHSVSNHGGPDVSFHQNFSGVTGVGESSGTVYTITGSASERFSDDSGASRQSVREN